MLNLGIGNCDLDIIKSAIAKGADLNKQFEGAGISTFPLCSAIGAASSVMLPADYSIIASRYVKEDLMSIRAGQSVIYAVIMSRSSGFFYKKVQKPMFHLILIQKIFHYFLQPKNRDIEIIKLLLDFKADPNISDDVGITALHVLGAPVAVPLPYKNAPEIAKLLISKGAKMTKVHLTGETPLALVKSMLNIIQSARSFVLERSSFL